MCDSDEDDFNIDVPQANPYFDQLKAAAPLLMGLNPEGEWRAAPPTDCDVAKLKRVAEYFIAAQGKSIMRSFCLDCLHDSQYRSGFSHEPCVPCVPLVVVPLYTADDLTPEMRSALATKAEQMLNPKPKPKKEKKNGRRR